MKLSIETKIQSIGNLYENTNSHTKANHRFATHQMVQELDQLNLQQQNRNYSAKTPPIEGIRIIATNWKPNATAFNQTKGLEA